MGCWAADDIRQRVFLIYLDRNATDELPEHFELINRITMSEPTIIDNPETTASTTQSKSYNDPRPIVNIVTPVGMLGYGLNEQETVQAILEVSRNGAPTAIVLDSGSTDSGPEKLALGTMSATRDNYVRDLTSLSRLGHRFKIPVIFGSAGGDGSDDHVREMVKILGEIAAETGNE